MIITILAEVDDGSLESTGQEPTDGVWPTDFQRKARQGNNVRTDPGADPISGARMAVGGYMGEAPGQHLLHLFQSWARFLPEKGFHVLANEELVTASLRLTLSGSQYSWTANKPRPPYPIVSDDSLQGWTANTTFPLSSGSWRDLESLRDNFFYDYEYYQLQLHPDPNNLLEAGGEQFLINLRAKLAAGTEHHELFTNWTSLRDFPGGTTFRLMWINTTNREIEVFRKPHLILRVTKKHDLNTVGASSIQMSDGTAVFLRYDRPTNRVGLYYQRVTATSATLVGWVPTTSAEDADNHYRIGEGFQTFSLTRDNRDNLFVAGMRGPLQGNHNFGFKRFNVNGYKYNGNYSWTRFSPSPVGENSLNTYQTHRSLPNNFAAVWLPNSSKSSSGQLAVVFSHRDGQWAKNQFAAMTMSAGWLIGDSSAARNYAVNYADIPDGNATWRPYNSVATGLDAFADGNTIRIGSFIPALSGSIAERSAAGQVTVSDSHTVGKPTFNPNSISTNSPHDPDAKIRILELADGRYAICRNGHIAVHNRDGSIYRQVDLTGSGVAGLPPRSTLQSTQAWDVVADSVVTSWIWMYFRDANNPRLLRKVRWNYTNGEVGASFQFTSTPLGESGSSIEAIRVPRGRINTRCVLVDVAMHTGAGSAVPLITLRDTTMNWAPEAPVLDQIQSFNAIGAKQFDWTFRDTDPTDFATAQDIEIRNVDSEQIVHDVEHAPVTVVSVTGKKYRYTVPGNTLQNDANYQVRLRSYDSMDFPSEFSEWVQFSTTATGGFVEITTPAADNEPLNRSSVDLEWVYGNSDPEVVQTGYRVRVFNNDTNVPTHDSGLQSGPGTSYTVTGLVSDIEYRIEVTVQDSNGQFSGAGIRLVTADFNNPSLPEIRVAGQRGYIEVRVTNPPPTGENPETTSNQIARKEANEPEEAYVIIGECPPNGVYQDWTVASGVSYTYKARGSNE